MEDLGEASASRAVLKTTFHPGNRVPRVEGKKVVVQMKSGDFLQDCEYKSTLFFGDGEFSTCTLVYFELEKPDGNRLYVCGSDILKIETKGKA